MGGILFSFGVVFNGITAGDGGNGVPVASAEWA
jgi:hypothetical protein